jgi:hypothetical protein
MSVTLSHPPVVRGLVPGIYPTWRLDSVWAPLRVDACDEHAHDENEAGR